MTTNTTAPAPDAVRAAIGALTEAVGRMTPGEWKNAGDFVAIVNEPVDRDPWEEYRDIVGVSGDGTANDLTGIALLRNAAPALLAVAEIAAHVIEVNPRWWLADDYEQGDQCLSCGAGYDAQGRLCEAADLDHKPNCRRDSLASALSGLASYAL